MSKLNITPVLKCLPDNIARAAETGMPEEIRIICGQAVMLYINGSGFFVTPHGDITSSKTNAQVATRAMINNIFCKICDNSVYAAEDEIRNGFVTLCGGHRVGICGTAVLKNGALHSIKHISALNIRIARQAIGAANKILPVIADKYIRNTLIVSPPGCGKTTLLRDLARLLGEKYKLGIADERSEIAAVYRGEAQNDVGIRTVVMDGCPKDLAINMMTRTMGIEIALTDEIGSRADAAAIKSALCAGIKIIATAHGYGHKEVAEEIQELIGGGGFERIITLSRRCGAGTVEEVIEC